MKILTSYIPKTSGTASICGLDVEAHSLETREKIGYLPEHNPLYKDMYVKEYLLFVARLHRQVINKPKRVQEMIERTGLEREQHKQIGMLSKGYKQRVGLAQAMLHEPEVLILDEPTSGLDPNQLVEIRRLIKDLGKEKTVIFSSHIMQEVQAICDRVVIINKGKLVANATIETLQQQSLGTRTTTVAFLEAIHEVQLKQIPKVLRVKPIGKNRWHLLSDKEDDIRASVFQFAIQQQLTLIELQEEMTDMESVFQLLTN
jgi:ABC-2 type transport system ATP-binding protein